MLVDHLLNTKKRIQKFKKTEDTRYIYRNELDKACFQHDMTYGDFENLARMAALDKDLRDKAFNIASNQIYDQYQGSLASMVYKFFDEKLSEVVDKSVKCSGIKNEIKQNEQLVEEFHKLIITTF